MTVTTATCPTCSGTGAIISDLIEKPAADPARSTEELAYIAAAKNRQRDGELEIDDYNVAVSMGEDPGAYVVAWIWISNEEAGLSSGEEK